MPDPKLNPIDQPLASLGGVGRERLTRLNKLGIRTIGDLLWYGPKRYEDRNRPNKIEKLRKGDIATVTGVISAGGVKRIRGGRSMFEFIMDDGTARLNCRWWNMPYMNRYYKTGDTVHVHGKVSSQKPLTMDHPEPEVEEEGEEFIHLKRVVPVYRLTEGVKQRWLRATIWKAVDIFSEKVSDILLKCRSHRGGIRLRLPIGERKQGQIRTFPGELRCREVCTEFRHKARTSQRDKKCGPKARWIFPARNPRG